MVRVKNGVSMDNVHHKIYIAIGFAAPVWAKYGSPDLWVTGANEGGHTTNPDRRRQFHRLADGTCQAADLRTWTIPVFEHRRLAVNELAKIMGPIYDVIFEEEIKDPLTGKILRGEHAHIQWDPDRPGTVA